MDKRRRLVELGKDVIIVLLTCSLLWLAAQSQLLGPLNGLLRGDQVLQPGPDQAQGGDRAESARPLRMAAALSGGTGTVYCGILYDDEAGDALFRQAAGVLVETLSSAGEPEEVARAQWERALEQAPAVYLDLQGRVPLSVLAGWLSGEKSALDAPVRRLVLTVVRDEVVLFYRDEDSGKYYRCRSQVASPHHLEEALASLMENGAFFAFQWEEYGGLDPDTLLPAETPAPVVYAASNPVTGGRTALEGLMEDLGLPVGANGIYRGADDEWVARSGGATLRLSDRGEAVYETGEGDENRFALPAGEEDDLFAQVELCRALAAGTLGSRCGEAGLYLLSAARTQAGLEVEFGYALDGCPVLLEEGTAARFLVREGRVDRFELRFRSYAAGQETTAVMPVRQAAAALEAQGLTGAELLLVYRDAGGDRAEAGWAADGGPAGEG